MHGGLFFASSYHASSRATTPPTTTTETERETKPRGPSFASHGTHTHTTSRQHRRTLANFGLGVQELQGNHDHTRRANGRQGKGKGNTPPSFTLISFACVPTTTTPTTHACDQRERERCLRQLYRTATDFSADAGESVCWWGGVFQGGTNRRKGRRGGREERVGGEVGRSACTPIGTHFSVYLACARDEDGARPGKRDMGDRAKRGVRFSTYASRSARIFLPPSFPLPSPPPSLPRVPGTFCGRCPSVFGPGQDRV
jgi:hypothetical protein